MAFHIKNPETDALARKLAGLKRTGLTEAVHVALAHEIEWESGKPTLVEIGIAFTRELRASGRPAKGKRADKATAPIALSAFERYGKGRHPARLNFGECFAYACARHLGQPLMFKGSDFPQTDIEAA